MTRSSSSSDVASLDEEDRAAIVSALLKGCAARTVSAYALDRRYYLADLSHPAIAAQLRPLIGDTAAPEDCRWLAISFVEACELQELQDELASVILAAGEPHSLRVHAAYALQRVGDVSHRARLRPLLSPEMPDDPDDQLRGCLLKCLWPDQLSVEQLIPVLTYPKQTSLYGSYKSFLLSEWAQSLQPEDLPIASEWAESENRRAGRIAEMHPFHECLAGIGRRAWELLPDPRAIEYLVSVGFFRSTDYQSVLIGAEKASEKNLYRADAVKRRLFLRAFVERFAQQRESANDVS